MAIKDSVKTNWEEYLYYSFGVIAGREGNRKRYWSDKRR